MEKQEIDFKLPYALDWSYEVEISQLKKDIEELEKLGATHVSIDHGISYDISSYVTIDAICRRIENDEEFQKRKNEFEARQAETKRREYKYLEEIKLKYGL